jgi:uncharacterized membrane protein YvlD (DUF360 family)
LYIARYFGCLAALCASCLLFGFELGYSVIAWAALLAGLYFLVKPVYSLMILPLDLLLFGLGTLCLDALMIRIAMPYDFSFWQALAAAAAVTLCFAPYERMRAAK